MKDIDSLNMSFESSAPVLARGDITVAILVNKGIAKVLIDNSRNLEWEISLLITANGDFAKNNMYLIKN